MSCTQFPLKAIHLTKVSSDFVGAIRPMVNTASYMTSLQPLTGGVSV